MKRSSFYLFACAAILTVSQLVAAPPDISGKWSWSFQGRDGQTRDATMKLKQDGNKITGTVTGMRGANNEAEISEGNLSDSGTLSFVVKTERNGQTFESKYKGEVKGDAITGKNEFTRNGETVTRDWKAQRGDPPKKAIDVTGNWKSTFTRQDGTVMEWALNLKQEGEKLAGSVAFNNNETDIKDGKVAGEDVTFSVLRERNGKTVTSKYNGKLSDKNTIKGTIESDWSGETRKFDWEAKRQ
jgi:hypothetical protein